MKKNEFLINSFSNIQDLIKFFEQKANILLVIYGIVFTSFVTLTNSLRWVGITDEMTIIQNLKAICLFLLSVSIGVLLVVQLYILIFNVIKPNKARHYKNGSKSLFYYSHIAEMEKEDFLKEVLKKNEAEYDKEVAEQVYEVSKIAEKKESYYSLLAIMLFYTFIFMMTMLLLKHL